ncbi:MAG: hypothetical protein JWL71_353 [Acidobacteria bacterium]|jgi:hypothetical protein|nr:hypothetical protein [Acidobacteriota bacterium]
MRQRSDLAKPVALRLQPAPLEAVDVKALALVLIALAMLAFAAGRIVPPPPVTASRSQPAVLAASHDSAGADISDAYGNEVTNAVAEYSLDPTGSLYELHSPQIELPHLGSPKS